MGSTVSAKKNRNSTEWCFDATQGRKALVRFLKRQKAGIVVEREGGSLTLVW